MNLDFLLNTAKATAQKAGEILARGGNKDISLNTTTDVKLKADEESERLIRAELNITKLPIIGEELGGDPELFHSDKYYWVVDPLDGTFNYLREQPATCVSIGLMKGKDPILGIIYNFNTKECLSGLVGKGVFLNDIKLNPIWADNISNACLMTGFPALADKRPEALLPYFETISHFKKIRMIGSAALAISYVASGKADVYFEKNTNLWDIAAGIALVKASGVFFEFKETGKRALNLNLCCAAKKDWLIQL